MSGVATEGFLRDWRFGQVQAERLSAAILHLEGFQDVDPQHPLGGRDGLKDVICSKDSARWIAAAYFPPTPTAIKAIITKFENDVKGVSVNQANGFIFFVNQNLTIGQRQKLASLSSQVRVEIYHLERLVSILNSPKGYGIRLEYLRISMSEDEQIAFWSVFNEQLVKKLEEAEKLRAYQMTSIEDKIDMLIMRTEAIEANLSTAPSSTLTTSQTKGVPAFPLRNLSVDLLLWIHRIAMDQVVSDGKFRGEFRTFQVWIGPPGSSAETSIYLPPPPERVRGEVDEFITWWNSSYDKISALSKEHMAAALAKFHYKFLSIHPFLDGNGRVAIILLNQAFVEMVGKELPRDFRAPSDEYFSVLLEANRGNLKPLEDRISIVL